MASVRNRGFLPQADAGLLAWSSNFKTLTTATPTAYGLTAAQATAYSALHTAFATAYQTAKDPDTRTKPNVAPKDSARAALRDDARLLAKIVEGTASVTDAQKLSLGLNVRAQPSPVPRPTARPGMDIASVANRTVNLRIHDSASSTRRGKPAGTVAAWVYSYVGTSYPSDPAAWNFEGATSKAKFEIVFPDSVVGGMQVWLCAAWINGKQEAGPVSVPITTNLQGGGTAVTPAMKLAA